MYVLELAFLCKKGGNAEISSFVEKSTRDFFIIKIRPGTESCLLDVSNFLRSIYFFNGRNLI